MIPKQFLKRVGDCPRFPHKQTFYSKGEAKREQHKRRSQKLSVYDCEWCGHYHLTSMFVFKVPKLKHLKK